MVFRMRDSTEVDDCCSKLFSFSACAFLTLQTILHKTPQLPQRIKHFALLGYHF